MKFNKNKKQNKTGVIDLVTPRALQYEGHQGYVFFVDFWFVSWYAGFLLTFLAMKRTLVKESPIPEEYKAKFAEKRSELISALAEVFFFTFSLLIHSKYPTMIELSSIFYCGLNLTFSFVFFSFFFLN